MTDTPNLRLPYIDAGQAQKHVTHNEALRILDSAVQAAVTDMTHSAPPITPYNGERYVVAASATGDWVGHETEIACWQDGAWKFLAPQQGWTIWSVADGGLKVFTGTAWRDVLDQAAHLGINTTADATNRLSIKSNAVLLSHDDVTPGTGDVRMVLNKSAAAKDAALVLQTGFSARALLGTLGSDDLAVKVSADGSTFKDALTIDRASGQVSLAQSAKFSAYLNFDKYCAANSWTKVQFNNARHNDFNTFDAANNQFVAPVAGYYALGYRVLFKANAALPASMTATLYKNGVELVDDARMQTSSALVNNRSSLSANVVLKLAAGDAIAVWAIMETNDGYVAAAQNSFYGYRIP
ncbi:DUF2793 domain-containing protein [Tardiphaga alba]|uniref:DUF2793 domain-containing protein n=1 Tax=Tardiphaga alba TaxID=340268 RepID=A0ABX8A9G0_9BRAD|nr:DUF2793 domain-containing protein [Tardiphaga alba]QUS39304.1 DUF2793 domain-containing protein [Tardiphaga alba]